MMEIQTKLKQWGRSFGIVIPMEKIKEENLSEDDILEIRISKKTNPLKQTFGTFKFKKTTDELLEESDKSG